MKRAYRPKSKDEVARNMSAIRSKNNRTELALRQALHALGLRYRKHASTLPGCPDIVFPRQKVAVFVDGDYWHGRRLREEGIGALRTYYTRAQQSYWLDKLQRNVARDDVVTWALRSAGWEVIRFWESDIRKSVLSAAHDVRRAVRRRTPRQQRVR
jgi:DNA mismatch endonuclease, patch repair protein